MKIKFDDIVRIELTELGENLMGEFAETHEEYNIGYKEHDSFVTLSFLAAMDFLTTNGSYDLIEDDILMRDKDRFHLTCVTTFDLTEAGEELFGTKRMSNHLKGIFEYMDLDAAPDEWPSLVDGDIEIDEDSYHTMQTYNIERMGKKVFCLEREDYRITVSDPSITPFHSYKFDTIKDAVYFYYDMTIERNINFRNGSAQWKTVASKYVYESGMLPCLSEFIDEMIKTDIEKTGHEIKNEYRHNFVLRDMLSGFCDEDNYEIIRHKNMNNRAEWYDFGCFLGDSQFSSNIAGVRFTTLNVHDLRIIQKWVSDFFEHTETVGRRMVRTRLEHDTNNKRIVNGKLYIYDEVYDETKNNHIETIILPGDKCDLRTLDTEYEMRITISEIKEDRIVTDKGIEYKLKDLLYMSHDYDSDDKELSYGKEECKKAIAKRLEDVLDKDIEELVEATVNTCWLCRREHGFNNGWEMAKEILRELKEERMYKTE